MKIETDRLILRRWREADASGVAALLGDPDVMEFSDHGPLDTPAQQAWLQSAISSPGNDPLSGLLAIEHKATGKVIGYVRLFRDLKRVGETEAELGFRLIKSAWGQGYASEACRGVIDQARLTRSAEKIVAIVDPGNLNSIRVLDKLGMHEVGGIMFEGYDYPDRIYAMSLSRVNPA